MSTDRARALLAEAIGIATAEVPADASMFTFDAWDSLAHMRLVLGLETELGAPLDAEQIVNLATLDDIAALLSRV